MNIERALDVMLGRFDAVNYAELGAAKKCIDKHLPNLWDRMVSLACTFASNEEYAAAVDQLRADLLNRYASGNTAGVQT